MAKNVLEMGDVFDPLKAVLDLLKYVYEEWKKHKGHKREQQDQFLEAATEALRQTLSYIGRDTYKRDRKREEELSRLWSKVALAARSINPDLAGRCQIKANYWANPERWTKGQIKAARIEIKRMEKEVNDYFKGKLKAKKSKKKASESK